ncbi:hypothetical protein SVIO_045140 [Streptomyces violaceusniger]|uniref:Secreted protein n=1 Tax=Streptomyces violaceusniger TaxID=68280 RepID=A0A4D4KX69_STRVO|nr:hypothetical protein SVIO_045140 [Streptomyces violaceusniger]
MSGLGAGDRRRGHAVVVRRADGADRYGLRSAARAADRGRLRVGERGLVLLDASAQTALALCYFTLLAVLALVLAFGADTGSGRGEDKGSGSAGPTRKPTQTPSQRESARPEESGEVRSYPAKGGRAVFDIRAASADLVSATPDGGWQMQVWKQSEWIRVDFVSGADTTTIFCTWHDGPPQVRIDEH